jgi:hypothetical protein
MRRAPRPSTFGEAPRVKLLLENLLYLADLALHFAADLLGRATILKIDITRRAAGFFLQLAFHFPRPAFGAVFRACSHNQ